MWQEFKKFALKGNVVDLAIGVIIGGAFGKIVSSLVNDIIMPIFGVITGGMNLKAAKWVIKAASEADGIAELSLNYGQFLQNVVDFLIISFSIFMVIKLLSRFKKKEEAKPEPEKQPEPTKEELLLAEIRDLLKKKK
jgi:large conductance mechanosensitive channel